MTSNDSRSVGRLTDARITEREAEVLAAVAQRLRNREIADRLHISVRTVESHIAALMRKLGAADRAALVGVGTVAAAGTAGRLPVQLTSFVGRQHETGEVSALLAEHRLVTLTGPAGAGKTRLALHLAAATGTARPPGGTRLADLGPVTAELVDDTVARALGVVPPPGRPVRDSIRDAVVAADSLLIVDNCEHVVAAVADLVSDLLSAADQLRVLATSRESLGVPGEVSYGVPPLPVPAPDTSPRAATARRHDAVRLFVDRAAEAAAGFTFTDADAGAVAALCRRLDGLPLAIELAAARLRTFSPTELVAHLDERFDLLTGGARTAHPRHRTLWSAIDWSYQLLSEAERTLFARLSVFPADFDYPAAQAVWGKPDRGDTTAMRLLPALVDKSLVTPGGDGDARRYRLLDSLRAYAVERLATTDQVEPVRRRHARYYLQLAERAATELRGPRQRHWVERLDRERPNLRAAMSHTLAAEEMEWVWRWVAALQEYWEYTGQRREERDWVGRVLARGELPATSATVAGIAAACGVMESWDPEAGLALAHRGAELAAGLGTVERAEAALAVGCSAVVVGRMELAVPALREAWTLFGDGNTWLRAVAAGSLAEAVTEPGEAIGWLRRSLALFGQAGDRIRVGHTLYLMADISLEDGIATDEVHTWLTECLEVGRATGNEHGYTHGLSGLARLAWLRGDRDRAADLLEECLPTLRRLGDPECTGRALYLLGERAREQERLAQAAELLRASVAILDPARDRGTLVAALQSLAATLGSQQCPRHAAMLLGAAHALRDAAGEKLRPVPPPDDNVRRSLTQVLGDAAFQAAYREGAGRSPSDAVQLTQTPYVTISLPGRGAET